MDFSTFHNLSFIFPRYESRVSTELSRADLYFPPTISGWDLTAEETKCQLCTPRSGVRSLVVWVAEIRRTKGWIPHILLVCRPCWRGSLTCVATRQRWRGSLTCVSSGCSNLIVPGNPWAPASWMFIQDAPLGKCDHLLVLHHLTSFTFPPFKCYWGLS